VELRERIKVQAGRWETQSETYLDPLLSPDVPDGAGGSSTQTIVRG
jgi:hypothetical protein